MYVASKKTVEMNLFSGQEQHVDMGVRGEWDKLGVLR